MFVERWLASQVPELMSAYPRIPGQHSAPVYNVTFAMNLGWAKTKEECAHLIVYQSAHGPPGDSIYHPTPVGPDFFHKTGGVL